jgi:polyisoprenoid-binding protein YceI
MKRLARTALALQAFIAALAQAAPVTYEIDPSHTYPSFEADHMGMSYWRGKFNKSSGRVTLDKAAGNGGVDLVIDLDSVDFGLPQMNAAAKGQELFDVARFPFARYRGQLEGFVNGAPTRAVGTLDLHGVTQPVTLEIRRFKCMPHPLFKREMCGADAATTLDREAFGITAGKAYGFSMAVELRIQVEALAAE